MISLSWLPSLWTGAPFGDAPTGGLGLGGAEEEALEHEVEHAAILRGLGEGRGQRLLEVGLLGPGDVLEGVEGVEDLGGAHGEALLAEVLGEQQQLSVEAARALLSGIWG